MKSKGQIAGLMYREKPYKVWYRERKGQSFQPLTEVILARKIPHYTELIEKARIKRYNDFGNQCKLKACVQIKDMPQFKNIETDITNFQLGTNTLMSMNELFEEKSVGYRLQAIAITSMHYESLRDQSEELQLVMSIKTKNREIIELLTKWLSEIEPRRKWHFGETTIHRSPVLDYRNPSLVERTLLDFDYATLKVGKERLRASVPYDDTLIMIIEASARQIREIERCSRHAGMIIISGGSPKYEGTSIYEKQLSRIDPLLFEQILKEAHTVGLVLDEWRSGIRNEDAWAKKILDTAKESLGKPDSRYRSVIFDPVKLADAVYLEVCRSFAEYVVAKGWIDVETADQWFAGAVEVFSPKSSEAPKLSRMEDPETFIQIVKKRYPNFERIAALDEPFRSKQENEGAIREISGVEYLVFPEDWLKKVYLKEAKKSKCDCTLAECISWMRDIQRQLCDAGVLKWDRRNPRFRYDLYRNGSRDSTYVLAIPLEKLK